MANELIPDDETNELGDQIALLQQHMNKTRPTQGSKLSLQGNSRKQTDERPADAPPSGVAWR